MIWGWFLCWFCRFRWCGFDFGCDFCGFVDLVLILIDLGLILRRFALMLVGFGMDRHWFCLIWAWIFIDFLYDLQWMFNDFGLICLYSRQGFGARAWKNVFLMLTNVSCPFFMPLPISRPMFLVIWSPFWFDVWQNYVLILKASRLLLRIFWWPVMAGHGRPLALPHMGPISQAQTNHAVPCCMLLFHAWHAVPCVPCACVQCGAACNHALDSASKAMATLAHKDEEYLHLLAQRAMECVQDFNPQECSVGVIITSP